ncbi:MAG: hypothetical protein H6574_14420 [Lewinellaceae bacterium]|nr:hypothetical protein [Saprospiraceae bacterium]MCB9332275.1 hypothetical protein [Lewinellaceae bacterium]
MLLLACCFSLCAVAQQSLQLTFQIDLAPAAKQISSKTNVGLRGGQFPLSWEKSLDLTDNDGDGIYTTTVTFENGIKDGVLEYKFILDDKTWELDGQNRLLLVKNGAAADRVDRWNELPRYNPEDLPKISVQQMRADLRVLQNAFTSMHPGLYRYRQPAEIAPFFAQLESAIQSPVTCLEAYRLFSEAAGWVQCGHTYANFFNQSGLIQQLVFDQPDKLPFCTRIIARRLFIEKNASEHSELTRGLEIRSINGVPFAEILNRLLPLVKADGPNNVKRLDDLQLTGLNTFESFDAYFPLVFPPENSRYTIDLTDLRTGQQFSKTVKAVSRQDRLAILTERYGPPPSSLDDLWEFKFLHDSIGYLRLGTFVTYQMALDWRAFLKNAFDSMKKRRASQLIIDIRGNEGGMDEVSIELAKYLPGRPIVREAREIRTRYQKVPADLEPYLTSWDNRFKDLSKETTAVADGYFRVEEANAETQIPVNKNAFPGKVYLLTDASNSSATFYLAQLLQKNKLATLVGQPTGGSQRGINGGLIAFLRLPNSGIEVDIPVFGSFPLEEKPAGGIVPDVVVEPNLDDVVSGIDTTLEKVFWLIQQPD